MKFLKTSNQLKEYILSAKDGDIFYVYDMKYQVVGKQAWINSKGSLDKHLALYSINQLVRDNIVEPRESTLAVCGILQIGNRFVSVKRKNEETFGFIGGKVEKNETTFEALIRETKEETGFEVTYDLQDSFYVDEDSQGNLVYCYKLKLLNNHVDVKEGEEPLLYLLTKEQLIELSPFGLYNKNAFNFFKL